MSSQRQAVSILSFPSIPWKNGGGTTRTLAVNPPLAGMDDFRWRISLAEITQSGAFSSFPGIDRTIMLWQGDGVLLHSPSWQTQTLREPWQPFAFRGEDEVNCELSGGPTTDLNLMVRCGTVRGELKTYRQAANFAAPLEAVVLLCAQGTIRVNVHGEPPYVLPADTLLQLSEDNVEVELVDQNAVFVAAILRPCP